MRKLLLAITAATFALTLSGCGTDGENRNSYREITYTMQDGRTVPCLEGIYTLECNWSELK